jgi:hypothetical protein
MTVLIGQVQIGSQVGNKVKSTVMDNKLILQDISFLYFL